MAKDKVTRQSWWKDEAFLSLVSKLGGDKINRSEQYFKEAELYYRAPPDGFAFFHRAVKVKGNYHYYISTN